MTSGASHSASMEAGIAAHQAGHLDEAERIYRDVIGAVPEDAAAQSADACALLGVVISAQGDVAEALRWIDRAIALDPYSGIFHFHRGNILASTGQFPQAIAAYTLARDLQPGVAHISYNLANALRAADDWAGAIMHYREALRLDPMFLAAANNLALSLAHEKNYSEAQQVVLQALARDANYGEAWLTLCSIDEKLKEYDSALIAGRRTVDLIPGNHYAWFGLGIALNRLGRDAEAVDAYKRAIGIKPNRAESWDNLAQTYQSLNRLDEALATYRRAVEVSGQAITSEGVRTVDENEYGDRHWHLALMELLRGDYAAGFARYRARFKGIKELKRLPMPCPLWKGEDLAGKSLLVCDEQGYGDTLMLARFLPVLRSKGARIVFSVHPVLASFLRGWDGANVVIAHEDPVPVCDYFCSSFDLPYLCGTRLDTVPNRVPYLPILPPDEATTLSAHKLKIGVVWGGSPLHANDAKRSVPLPIFANLFTVKGLHFYSFNRDMKPGDAEIMFGLPVENLAPRLTDFAIAARLIGQMDIVITCDSATAHLAGGMGKKTWILLPFAPDWRWLTERSDSPWYPTAHLFRQPEAGDWASVIADVKFSLLAYQA